MNQTTNTNLSDLNFNFAAKLRARLDNSKSKKQPQYHRHTAGNETTHKWNIDYEMQLHIAACHAFTCTCTYAYTPIALYIFTCKYIKIIIYRWGDFNPAPRRSRPPALKSRQQTNFMNLKAGTIHRRH